MDNEQPHQELVKCVVVGDTAVGKTRLICARVYNKQFSLSQLLNTHVPTVWAIDQYRIYKEVLERSWVSVDGVNVSLRLWDTFGDHDKDRRFAYGRSDVVVLCFSVSNPVSLRNCLIMWYPEIRKFCPDTPILLVGCKNDLRYIYKDDEYMKFCQERSPLVRATRECDLVMPCEARAIAREIGVDYYETSVLSFYGITELFDNVIRSALISRRQNRFWMTNLKRVQRPLPQVPFCPPKPELLHPTVHSSTIYEDLHLLYQGGAFADLMLIAGETTVCVHQFVVAAASSAFHRILHESLTTFKGDKRRFSDDSATFGDPTIGNFNSDTECLLENDSYLNDSRSSFSPCSKNLHSNSQDNAMHKILDQPPFQSISFVEYEGSSERKSFNKEEFNSQSVKTVIIMSNLVSGPTLLQLAHFMYTGSIFCRRCLLPLPNLSDLRQVAEYLEMLELKTFLTNLLQTGQFSSENFRQEYVQVLLCRLSQLDPSGDFLTDVVLEVDDGSVSAHRALLMVRCDMMRAMFSGGYRESNAKVVTLPGVKLRTFQVILHYLYTDTIPALTISECLPTVELANRLCLPRLITLVEQEIVDLLNRILKVGGDISENCLYLLEPLQMHNADQLVDWCLTYLSSNYNQICGKFSKQLRSLHPENQAWLNQHRWPPVWYLKDFDFYERCLIERQREDNPLKPLKRTSIHTGCLCFSSKSCRK